MMKRTIRRNHKEIPELNTSSLPDLIFTVLFFFMIVTNMRHETMKVEFRQPKGTKLEKLENKSLVTTIYVGRPTAQYAEQMGNATRIQINDKFVSPDEIQRYMSAERMKLSDDDRENMVVSLKIDKQTEMGIVTDIKQALKKAYTLKITYVGENETKQ